MYISLIILGYVLSVATLGPVLFAEPLLRLAPDNRLFAELSETNPDNFAVGFGFILIGVLLLVITIFAHLNMFFPFAG